DISHIENTDLEQVKLFFFTHYAPNNAILTLTGNINYDLSIRLCQKWFGPIEKRNVQSRKLPPEPIQKEGRVLIVEKDVPSTALYKVWHIGPRNSPDFSTLDLITDLLAGGESGRLYTKLVREKKLFSEINAYLTSDIDPGLIFIHGKLMKGIDIQHAEEAINEVITNLQKRNGIHDEMEKVKNKFESSTVFSNTGILNKAMNLSFYELLGDAGLINLEIDAYRKVSREMVVEGTRKYLVPSNCSTLYYKSTRKE
ncbi:MAG: insulinase family protein, partial [Bacteroidetes bacterium]